VSNALEGAAGAAAAGGQDPAAPAGRAGSPLRLYIAGLTAAAVLLAVATALLAVTLRDSSNAGQQRSAILLAARQEAINLTNLDQQAGSRDFNAVLAGSAGSLRQQLTGGRSAFLKAVNANSVTSSGAVLDAGIVSMTSSTATVLLNVKATVRNKQTSAPETRIYHWQAGLVHSGGRWLVSGLEFL
jgi:Mce-associated membrane protein